MISDEALKAWKAYAINCTGEEAVGIIFNGKFYPVKNVAADPAETFRTDPREILSIVGDGDVEAVLHTHLPHHPSNPSKMDLERQIDANVPFGISVCDGEECSDPLWFGDQVPIRPLLGRPFIYRVWDCFSLVRDFHRINGVTFDDFAREDDWWNEEGKDYYMENLDKAGFIRIEPEDRRPGDCFLMNIHSVYPVNNHAGIYMGNDLFMHHQRARLSNTDIIGRWMRKVNVWVRHKDLPVEVTFEA